MTRRARGAACPDLPKTRHCRNRECPQTGPQMKGKGLGAAPAATQQSLAVDVIKQYPGAQQVERAVQVKCPGKHFPQLQPAEQKEDYWATAVESAERHKFAAHSRAWGAAHTGPGIRFSCSSDAIEDPC